MEAGSDLREKSRLFSKQLKLRNSPVQDDEVDIRKLGWKLHQERKRAKIDPNQIELSALREKSNKIRDSKFINVAESTKRPNGFEFDDDNVLVMSYQRILEKSRHEKKHGIVRKTDSESHKIVTIVSIQKISESLCVINIENTERRDIIWLSCLWNEWIELKIGDMMILEEIINISNIKLCKKWKKVL